MFQLSQKKKMEGNNKYHPSDAAFAPLTYNQLVLFSLTLQTTTIFLDSLKADRYFYFFYFFVITKIKDF